MLYYSRLSKVSSDGYVHGRIGVSRAFGDWAWDAEEMRDIYIYIYIYTYTYMYIYISLYYTYIYIYIYTTGPGTPRRSAGPGPSFAVSNITYYTML